MINVCLKRLELLSGQLTWQQTSASSILLWAHLAPMNYQEGKRGQNRNSGLCTSPKRFFFWGGGRINSRSAYWNVSLNSHLTVPQTPDLCCFCLFKKNQNAFCPDDNYHPLLKSYIYIYRLRAGNCSARFFFLF